MRGPSRTEPPLGPLSVTGASTSRTSVSLLYLHLNLTVFCVAGVFAVGGRGGSAFCAVGVAGGVELAEVAAGDGVEGGRVAVKVVGAGVLGGGAEGLRGGLGVTGRSPCGEVVRDEVGFGGTSGAAGSGFLAAFGEPVGVPPNDSLLGTAEAGEGEETWAGVCGGTGLSGFTGP